jgi:cytochrome b
MMHKQSTKVWDPLVRIGHWTLVVMFCIAYLTEDHFLLIHTYSGYIILGYVAVRLVWGVIGPRYARFSDFVCAPKTVAHYIGQELSFKAPRYLGHNPVGGAMIIALILSLILTTLSGVMTYGIVEGLGPLAQQLQGWSNFMGELLEEVHEFFANFTLLLVGLHVAGVALASFQHRENLVASMIHGRKSNPSYSTETTTGAIK